MIFSLFGKGKSGKGAKGAERGPQAPRPATPIARPTAGAASATAAGADPSAATRAAGAGGTAGTATGIDPRSLTRKIDAIETEMALASAGASSRGRAAASAASKGAGQPQALSSPATVSAPTTSRATVSRPTASHPTSSRAAPARGGQAPQGARAPQDGPDGLPSLEQSTSAILGGDDGLGHLEIGASGVPPVIEEAAILHANDQGDAAVAVLSQAIRDEQLGPAAQQAWLMLLDLHQFVGRQEEFESLAIQYASRFESSPPAWQDDAVGRVPADAPRPGGPGGRATVALPAQLDAGVARQIESIDRAVQRGRDITVDCRAVRSLDLEAARLLLATLARLERGSRDAVFVGAEKLEAALRASVESGRRDADPSAWLLLIATLRLMGRQLEFEDASIEYCITFEVSPPSWEPMPAHLRTGDAEATPTVSADDGPGGRAAPRADAFVLAGEVEGTMEAELAALRTHADRHRHVFVDCSRLKRLDFVAAGQLLNVVTGLRAGGCTLEFAEPSHLVAALLAVMGLHELATVTLRRL